MEERVREIHDVLAKRGGKVYYCGGYVRDKILGVEPKDIDLEVFNLGAKEVEEELKKLGRVKKVGRSYEILLFEDIEISVPDLDVIDIGQCIGRRDLTMNSLYMDVKDGRIIDKVNGIEDIKNRIIRVNSEKVLREDPIRILRIAQLKGRLGFEVDRETERMCYKYRKKLRKMPKERVFIELEKILLKSRKPSTAFEWLREKSILKEVLPEVEVLARIEQGKKYHPEGDVFVHTMLALDVLKVEERSIDIMFGILLHDIGKAMIKRERKGNHITFYGHEEAGAQRVREVMERFTNNNDVIDSVEKLVRFHMYPSVFERSIKSKTVKKLANNVDFYKIMKVHKADTLGRGVEADITYIDKALELYEEIKNRMEPLIKGKDLIGLGMKPGKEFGVVLKDMYQRQLNEEFDDYDKGMEILNGLVREEGKN